MYDIVVIGGGTAGCATAISSAKNGAKVLLIEKNSFLGGTMTGALVTPMMKNILQSGEQLSSPFCEELMQELSKTNDSLTFSDGNTGWFNPEIMKCILDDMCEKYSVKVLFDSVVTNATVKDNNIVSCEIYNCGNKHNIDAKYFVDATGNADVANLLNIHFNCGNNGTNQAMTLRFIATNVNIEKFAIFLREIDKDINVSPIEKINNEIHLSTACTWDNDAWKLKPYFDKAVQDGVLTKEDCAYFQIFTIPNQPTSIAFNAPRIYAKKTLNPLDVNDTSYALIQGRKQIRRLISFCNKYLPGFENAYISQIASMLGVRDSRRVECNYTLTEDDILSAKKVNLPVAKSNYPIDVHSNVKNKNILNKLNENDYYEIPLDCLKVKDFNNFYVAGKIISATFLAQASLRIIPNCISMGENLGKYLATL